MTGKSILMLVVGFITIYAFIGFKLNTVSYSAVDNMADYFEETFAKNIASTGANMAANKLFLDETYEGEMSIDTLFGGQLDVTVETIDEFTELKVIRSVGTVKRLPPDKDLVREVRITVRPSKFSKFSYFCENEPDDIWWYGADTVWGPMHVNSRMNVWQTPVFMGKVTCLKELNIYDDPGTNPVFNGGLEIGVDKRIPQLGIDKIKERALEDGKVFSGHETVTIELLEDRLRYKYGADGDEGIAPSLELGWVSIRPLSPVIPGTTVTFVFQHESLVCNDFAGEQVIVDADSWKKKITLSDCEMTINIPDDAEELEIEITLDKDDYSELSSDQLGKVKWNFDDWEPEVEDEDDEEEEVGGWTEVDIDDIAPNGVIFVDGGDVRLKGTLDGRVTIAAATDDTDASKGGNVWLDGDVVYKEDPRINKSSNDLLGICAQKNVLITDNLANGNDINIHGAIYAESGGFGAENHDSRGFSGNINLLGGITQMERLPVGSTAGDGFWKKYRYDERLMDASPPAFPGTGGFEVVSWFQ